MSVSQNCTWQTTVLWGISQMKIQPDHGVLIQNVLQQLDSGGYFTYCPQRRKSINKMYTKAFEECGFAGNSPRDYNWFWMVRIGKFGKRNDVQWLCGCSHCHGFTTYDVPEDLSKCWDNEKKVVDEAFKFAEFLKRHVGLTIDLDAFKEDGEVSC